MSVLKGEGNVPILYRTGSVAVGPVDRSGYIARPNQTGEWPTVIVVPSAWGVTSATKALCRQLARWGLAAVAPDVYGGSGPRRSAAADQATAQARGLPPGSAEAVIADAAEYIANPAGFWSNAEEGFGVLGIGEFGRAAVAAAKRLAGSRALALCYSPLVPNDLVDLTAPLLGIYGKADETFGVDDVMSLRSQTPHAEWVLYDGVGSDFLDDFLDEYDDAAASDALDRLVGFFGKHLPPGGSAA